MVHIGNTVLGDGTVKICIPLAGKNREVLAERMTAAITTMPFCTVQMRSHGFLKRNS